MPEDPAASVDRLLAEFDSEGREAPLAEAEQLVRRTLASGPPQVDTLLTLATVTVLRGRAAGSITPVDDARAAATEAAALLAPGDELWAYAQGQLAWVLSVRYEMLRRPADLAAAMHHATAAAAVSTEPDVLWRCVNAYRLSFERFGRLADIDEAVRIGRVVARSPDPGHVVAARNALAICLAARYSRTGDRADIDEAVGHCRAALAEVPRRHIDRIALGGTLVVALLQRSARGDGPPGDLPEAIRLSRELIASLPNGDALRAQLLANHAALMFLQSLDGESAHHMEEAVRRAREAVDVLDGGALRAGHQTNLANIVLVRARLGSDPDGVRQAVEIGKAALAGLSPGNPDRARALNVLGRALHVRHLLDRDPADLDAAIGMWRSASGSRVGQIEIRVAAAQNWAEAVAGSGDAGQALEAYSTAVGLLPLLAWRGLDRRVQEKRLATVTGLASEAAACALAAGRPERAVELLEQGRQVLWSQAVQTRSDLSVLAAADPALAAELDAVRRELDGGASGDADLLIAAVGGTTPADLGDSGHRRRLAERWEELVSQARRRPGLEGFLTPPSFAALRAAADGGAVVLVSAMDRLSFALVVTAQGVREVPLPWLSAAAAQRRASALLTAEREVERGGGAVAGAALRQTLVSIQRWLWDTVTEPVCAVLDEVLGAGRRHRVWWCPTGPLTMLPLHAAGRFGAAAPLASRRRLSVAARCVSSYTPSLSALLRARTGPAGSVPVGPVSAGPVSAGPVSAGPVSGGPVPAGPVSAGSVPGGPVPGGPVSGGPVRAFAVGVGTLAGQAPLPAVSDELRAVSAHVPGLRVLTGRNATVPAVLAALEQHSWAHFACHGEQDFDRPSAGSLRLADGRLSVLDLASRTRGGELAYLSACRTAAGGRDLPDEAIHLTAALQLAGFRHVIGSQWAVSDRVAAQVAADVYAVLAGPHGLDASRAAYALDAAIDRVRRERPDRPDLWAALIHTGP